MFALWQDCGQGADTREVRAQLEALIRVHMSRGSLHGFSAAELEHYNHGLTTKHRFDPYGEQRAHSPG